MLKGFCKLNALQGLASWQATAIGMPISRGGCGLRQLTSTCEAAYVGAWLQCASHVAAVTGAELRDDANPLFHDVHQAMSDLQELYGIDALRTLGMSWHDVLALSRDNAQRDISRAVTDVLCKDWYGSQEPLAFTGVHS